MKHFLPFFCLLSSVFAADKPILRQARDSPKVIVIFADDQGWVDLGCQGSLKDIRTPWSRLQVNPGSPWQNGYIESFNGKFRDECLNEQWFQTLPQAKTCIAEWRRDYNEVRPHSSLGRIPPAQFAQQHRINSNAAANTNHQVLE